MVSTDPISDMLTRIRNAVLVSRREVVMPHSNVKEKVAQILVDNNFLDGVSVEKNGVQKSMTITINGENENSRITEMSRLSKPGRRMYSSASKIPTVKRGRGIVVISTSQGVMSGQDAWQRKIGGEVICYVW